MTSTMIEKIHSGFNRYDYVSLFYDTKTGKYILFINNKKKIISDVSNNKAKENLK